MTVTTQAADLLARRIAQGAGETPADLVIGDVRLFDMVSGALTEPGALRDALDSVRRVIVAHTHL